MQTSTYHEDDYDPEDMEEQIESGESGYCDVTLHYDWADNIHGFPTLLPGRDWVSCCDDCGHMFAAQVVKEALDAKLGGAEIIERVKAHFEDDNYDDVLANQIVAALREELAGRALAATNSPSGPAAEVTG